MYRSGGVSAPRFGISTPENAISSRSFWHDITVSSGSCLPHIRPYDLIKVLSASGDLTDLSEYFLFIIAAAWLAFLAIRDIGITGKIPFTELTCHQFVELCVFREFILERYQI